MVTKRKKLTSLFLLAAMFLGDTIAGDEVTDNRKLQIVFMLGQGEMVGHADVSCAVYMLKDPLVPPRKETLNAHKAVPHQINGAYLYWQAMNSYDGPPGKKAELKALIAERARFKQEFRQDVLDELEKNDGMFRGKKYAKRRGRYRGFWLFNMCDLEAEKKGITPRIRAILDGPDNRFNVEKAYKQLLADSQARHQKQIQLNKIYLGGTTTDDFAAYADAVKSYEAGAGDAPPDARRRAIAKLAEEHLHLPVAKHTYITALGTIAGTAEGDAGNVAGGKLSIGYGANERSIGLEYAAGIALEQSTDAPVLIVKCAWDSRRSMADFWRMPASENGASEQEPGAAWKQSLAHIRRVLADPGKYHPGYDPKTGYEPAGLIWFQGTFDEKNPEYATQFTALLEDLRKAVGKPELPVVCATVGTMFFKGESDDHPVNRAMRNVAAMDEFESMMDVMDTYRWRTSELSLIKSMIHKRKISPDAAMQDTLRHGGAGVFYLLAGHEAGSRLAKLIDAKESKK